MDGSNDTDAELRYLLALVLIDLLPGDQALREFLASRGWSENDLPGSE